MAQPVEKKKVLVIGGGFGGVFAAKALERDLLQEPARQ